MASLNLRGILALGILAFQFVLPVHTLPLQAQEIPAVKRISPDIATPSEVTNGVEGVEGVAVYYAKSYNGKRTHSGTRYNPARMTAAHPDFPLGTKVKVVNLANKREVVVTINDRCRKRKTPIIDLSRAAARKLGFLGKGMARVLIVPLKEETS